MANLGGGGEDLTGAQVTKLKNRLAGLHKTIIMATAPDWPVKKQ